MRAGSMGPAVPVADTRICALGQVGAEQTCRDVADPRGVECADEEEIPTGRVANPISHPGGAVTGSAGGARIRLTGQDSAGEVRRLDVLHQLPSALGSLMLVCEFHRSCDCL